MMAYRNPWTLSVDGGEPISCDFEAGIEDGLKYMAFTLYEGLPERVGDEVRIRLAGRDRFAEGTGYVLKASVDPDGSGCTTIHSVGPLALGALR